MVTKPPPHDPLSVLYEAIEQAQFGQRISLILDKVQRIDETDEQTLIRLIQERLTIASILREFKIFHDKYDDTYRNNDVAEDIHNIISKLRQSNIGWASKLVEINNKK